MSVFTAKLDGWVAEVPARINAVRKASVQRVLSIAQEPVGSGGNMPIKDGFLRASLVVRLGEGALLQTSKPKSGVPYAWDASSIALTIAGAGPKDVITGTWTAEYARLAHYGGENRVARKFRDLAAQQWPQVVAEEAAEAKRRGELNVRRR
jgi:hypothetical protein